MTGRPAAVALAVLLAVTVVGAVAAEQARAASSNQGAKQEVQARRVVNAITREFGAGPLGACFWRIAWRESKLDPHAANLTDRHADGSRGSFGALQIGALWRRPGESVEHFARRMFDPVQNAEVAHRLYDRYGFQPWGGCW